MEFAISVGVLVPGILLLSHCGAWDLDRRDLPWAGSWFSRGEGGGKSGQLIAISEAIIMDTLSSMLSLQRGGKGSGQLKLTAISEAITMVTLSFLHAVSATT